MFKIFPRVKQRKAKIVCKIRRDKRTRAKRFHFIMQESSGGRNIALGSIRFKDTDEVRSHLEMIKNAEFIIEGDEA